MNSLIQNGTEIVLSPFNLQIDVNYAGVLTTFTYPAGTEFLSVEDINDGEMSLDGLQWTIDNYVKNFNSSITIRIVVTDVVAFSALAPEDRKVVGDTTDLTGEVQLVDNVAEKLIFGITCPDILACIGNLPEYDNMADATTALGDGQMFLYSLDNTEGQGYRGLFVTPLA